MVKALFSVGVAVHALAMSDPQDSETAIRRACPSWARLQDMVVDGWRILRPIGRGGACEIYLCEHQSSAQQAAMKLLLPSRNDDSEALKLLLREADFLEDLEYPLVPDFLGQVQVEGQHGILMEYVAGESLHVVLRRGGKLPALAILMSAVKTLAYLHEQNVVHNDIKPENFHMSHKGRLYLLDYGAAQRQSLSSTFFRRLKSSDGFQGTLTYCAPELLSGKQGTYASDVWAIGIMAHVLFVGSPPYQVAADDRLALAKAIKAAHIPPLSQRVTSIDTTLSNIIDRCLQPDPQLRHPNATELLRLLRKYRDVKQSGTAATRKQGSPGTQSQTSRKVVQPRRP
ncbi:MAG: serine/threonine protein kinase [Planctomycetota bacterium]|nr:MAG: serine/threonine protein kinase [Planctomycetota bacterium]